MDYKKRDYKLPLKKVDSIFSYELAYELGAQYQEELIARKSEYLKEVKAKKKNIDQKGLHNLKK